MVLVEGVQLGMILIPAAVRRQPEGNAPGFPSAWLVPGMSRQPGPRAGHETGCKHV